MNKLLEAMEKTDDKIFTREGNITYSNVNYNFENLVRILLRYYNLKIISFRKTENHQFFLPEFRSGRLDMKFSYTREEDYENFIKDLREIIEK